MDPIINRADLIRRLRQMADFNWCGGWAERMTIAETAAQVIEMLGQSADETQEKLAAMEAKLDALLAR